jgi:hypothetical protein
MKALVIGIIVLMVCGCENAITKNARLNGSVVTDTKGNKWLLKHNIGDTYFMYQVRPDGSINLGNE